MIQAVATATASSSVGLATLTAVRAAASRLNPGMTHEKFDQTFRTLVQKEVLAPQAHDYPSAASKELQAAMIPSGTPGRPFHAVDLRRGYERGLSDELRKELAAMRRR